MWIDSCSGLQEFNVAIKVMLKMTWELDVKAEVNNMSILNNPYLVKLHAVVGCTYDIEEGLYTGFDLTGNVYLVTELCQSSLADLDNTLVVSNIFKIINHIAKGLQVLHDLRILHCDLKPANIMIGYDENFKIGDFGCSKRPPYTNTDRSVGSPAYMAPELFVENTTYSPAVDIYSLGILTCELYTNKIAYIGKGYTPSKIGPMVRAGERPDTTGIPDNLKSLIKSCWHQDPGQRPNAQYIIDITDAWLS